MKISIGSVILALLAGLSILACSRWTAATGGEGEGQRTVSRRVMAIQTQATLDDMNQAISEMRAKAAQDGPAQLAALERELVPMERLLQQTQKQLLLFGAENEVTRQRIRESFQASSTWVQK